MVEIPKMTYWIEKKLQEKDDKLFLEKVVIFFTLKPDVLKMITDCIFNTTDSPDAKLIFDFMDGIGFDTHARGKSLGDGNFLENYSKERSFLASGRKRVIPHEAIVTQRVILP